MNKLFFIAILCLGIWSFDAAPPTKGTLILYVENIKVAEGDIWVGIYDSQEVFLVKERSLVKMVKVGQKGQISIPVNNLPYGEYAVGLFQDLNGNATMDQNYWGVPVEPFAFSGHLRSMWRLPEYDETKFTFKYSGQKLNLSLRKWWQRE